MMPELIWVLLEFYLFIYLLNYQLSNLVCVLSLFNYLVTDSCV